MDHQHLMIQMVWLVVSKTAIVQNQGVDYDSNYCVEERSILEVVKMPIFHLLIFDKDLYIARLGSELPCEAI